MKITGVETLHADGGWRPWAFWPRGAAWLLGVPGDLGWTSRARGNRPAPQSGLPSRGAAGGVRENLPGGRRIVQCDDQAQAASTLGTGQHVDAEPAASGLSSSTRADGLPSPRCRPDLATAAVEAVGSGPGRP